MACLIVFNDSGFPEGSVHYRGVAREPLSRATHRASATRLLLEAFIAARYAAAYGARVEHFCPHLVGLPAASGNAWRAGVGYTPAAASELYLEHYLDRPIEAAIAGATGSVVAREDVVEVGNLASASPGAAREIIVAMRAHLARAGFTWVTFTATRELRNSFARLGLRLVDLGRADPARLPDGGAAWGRYYAHDPVVVAGALRAGVVHAAVA